MSGGYRNRAGHTILELIAAAGILAVVMSCFSVALRGVYEMEQRCVAENRGIVVLNNVVVRLAAEPEWDRGTAEGLLADEFARSDLAGGTRYHPSCAWDGSTLRLAVVRRDGGSLADVEVGR